MWLQIGEMAVDWCLDTAEDGAAPVLEQEIHSYLRRRAVDLDAVELACELISEMLDGLDTTSRRHWVTLDWEELYARFGVRALPEAGTDLPGSTLRPGVTVAHEVLGDLERLSADRDEVWLTLGVARAAEATLDALPGSAPVPPRRDDFLIGVAATMATVADGSRTGEELAAVVGATAARQAEDSYRAATGIRGPLTAHQAAEAFIEFERAIGGDFFLVHSDDHRAVLGNRRCPFGAQVVGRPQLCRVTSATAGGLAASQGAAASVTLDERIALGDHQCRLIIDLAPDHDRPGSHRYTDPPTGLPSRDPFAEISAHGYRVAIALRLPRDRLSVPLIRHLSQFALAEVGVVTEVIDACVLAVTEACGNVLDHAGPGDAYDVSITIGPALCEVRVIDMGRGFDFETLGAGMPNVDSEQGRGLALMHALMDSVHLVSQPESGTICHLVKELEFDEDSLARRLLHTDAAAER